jgi:Uma2 family endonuclease
MSAALQRLPIRMTLDEFLSWEPDDGVGWRWQLVDGEPVAMAPAADAHGAIQNELGRLLANHLVERRSPRRVVTEPGIVPHVRAGTNYRIPDLGVTCAPPEQGRIEVREPVLLVEILSPSNERETRANIWAYATVPSVREILSVRSTRIEAELLRRRGDGTWPEQADLIPADGTLDLASVGFTVPLIALYRTTTLAG